MNYRFILKAFSVLAVLFSASFLYSQSQETTSTQPSPQAAALPQADNNAQASDKNAASEKNAASDKDTAKPQAPTAAPSKGCLAVKPIGSHVFRNVMLLGVTGALISKQQYKVMDAVDYPARVGTKFHGDDLMTISSNGTKVVILNKHYKEEDLQKACH